MAPHALSALITLAAATGYAAAQSTSLLTWPATPAVSLHFPKPTDLPPKVWPDEPAFARGPQTGYNQCNSTTEGPTSECQTAYVNDISDFCLFAPPEPNATIADTEGIEVVWCTKKGYGTRIIPDGTLLGLQVLKNNDYTMITGFIDQTKINIQAGDPGGELDSGAQDGRSNPIGGMVYSNDFDPSLGQIQSWTEFIGNGAFCIKICNPNGPNPGGYCQHTLDEIGLGYNCGSKYTIGVAPNPGEFEVCDTADMGIPGQYTDSSGATQSFSQPPETPGAPPFTVPYQPTLVASSNCQTFVSSSIYTDAPAATGASTTGSSVPASATGSGSGASPTSGAPGGTKTGASGTKTPAPTGTASGSGSSSSSAPSSNSGAGQLVAGSAVSAILAAVAFVAFL